MKSANNNPCPCGGKFYPGCCARFIECKELASTAEQLMRSRYTAYTLGKDAYLRQTWHPNTRPEGAITDAGTKWLGLEVRRHEQHGDAATVEFIARYKIGGRAQRLHEVSRFAREQGNWYYVDGTFPERQQ
jgi:SEC-C motif-containing protein